MTVLSTLHDLHLAAEFCSRLVLLDRGLVMCEGTPEEIIAHPALERAFGVKVAVARPEDHATTTTVRRIASLIPTAWRLRSS